MAAFLGFFPRLMEKLRLLEGAILEAERAGEVAFAQRLAEVRAELTAQSQPLLKARAEIDTTLRFLAGTAGTTPLPSFPSLSLPLPSPPFPPFLPSSRRGGRGLRGGSASPVDAPR